MQYYCVISDSKLKATSRQKHVMIKNSFGRVYGDFSIAKRNIERCQLNIAMPCNATNLCIANKWLMEKKEPIAHGIIKEDQYFIVENGDHNF